MSRCQIQLGTKALREKMRRAHSFLNLFSSGEKGFFIAPKKESNVMQSSTGFMKALKCRECGREYPLAATHVCEFDFGPLEVVYDYERIKKTLSRTIIASRPHTMWRYRELLPVAFEPTVGCQVGFTPLVKADRLAKVLGVRELWVKNDTVNYPTLDRKSTRLNSSHVS